MSRANANIKKRNIYGVSSMELAIVTIVVYFLITLIIGWCSSRGESAEGFLLGDRELGTVESATTMLASKTGAGFLLVGTAIVIQFGMAIIWFALGQLLGFLIFYFFVPHLRRLAEQHHFYTIADYFRTQHGDNLGRLVALVSFIGITLAFLINLLGGSKVLSVLSGWSFEASLAAIFLVVLAYLLFGGYRAVSRTDFVQYLVIFVILGSLAVACFQGAVVLPASYDLMAVPFTQLLGWFLLGILLPFFAAELWQRIYSAKSTKVAQRSVLMSGGVYIISLVFISVMGLAIASALPDVKPETALIIGLQNLLPGHLSVVASVLFLAAIMSSADTFLFTSSSILIQDFGAKERRNSEAAVRRVRFAMMGIGFSVFLLAFFFRDLIELTFITLAIIAPIGVLSILSWLRPSIHSRALIVALVLAEIAIITASFVLKHNFLILIAIVSVLLGLMLVWIFQPFLKDRSPT